MKKIISLFILLLSFITCFCQELQQVPHCPSNEIYDMMIDKKGFLWIAHSLGVSRYDGVSFENFSNPEESSISMTDLIEDNYGRIWCHNFNNQVFYIKNDKMYYLKEYNFKSESVFPRMVLYGNDLVVTSNKGLFICNTKDLSCNYIIDSSLSYYKNKGVYSHTGITDICVVNNKLLALGNIFQVRKWFSYVHNGTIHMLAPKNESSEIIIDSRTKLEPHAIGDTIFTRENNGSLLKANAIKNDSISPIYTIHLNAQINTTSVLNHKLWINTNKTSFLLHGNDTLYNYNFSAITGDSVGNVWYGSLTKGLFSQNKTTKWQLVKLPQMPARDNIRLLKKYKNGIIMCSSAGSIFTYNPRAKNYFIKVSNLQSQTGISLTIENFLGDKFSIGTAKGMYIFDVTTNKLQLTSLLGTSGNIAVRKNIVYVPASNGLLALDMRNWGISPKGGAAELSSLNNALFYSEISDDQDRCSRKQGRIRAVTFDSVHNTMFVAFSDGLEQLGDSTMTPVLYKGQPLYISAMVDYGKKIYAGSFNNGLFVITPDSIIKIDDNSELPFDAIVKMKRCNNHLWIFRTHDIQVLDGRTDKFITIPPLPDDVADITDVEEDSANIYLATYHGLFTIPVNTNTNIKKNSIYLLYLLVNDKDTVYTSNVTLANNKNNLLFKLAIPVYDDADKLHFKYSLVNANGDTTWYYTQDAQRDIQFNALKPGSYTFEAIAIKDDEVVSNAPLIYNFSIDQPWFNTWWFYTCVLLAIISAALALQQYRLRQILKIERIRRKISNDLHDDIGSTLSSINVYSELAKRDDDNKEYVNTIQQNTVAIINNLDDLVWNINPKNDILENLLNRMRLFAEPLLNENNIECIFAVNTENIHLAITPDLRTHIYLLFKEMVNNVIKHSGCTICNIDVTQKGKLFGLTVKDNGRGFNPAMINRHRNGLHNMQQRTNDIKGEITINSLPGTGTEITVTCTLK